MKARMKKLISISIPVLGLALLVVLGSALADGPARDPVTICGSEVDLNAPGGPLGDATLTIRGDTFSGTVRIGGEAPPEPTRDGLYLPAATHFFDFGDGNTLKMLGEEYLVATDEDPLVFTLHGNAEIIEATGVFDGVSGELRISATINRNPDVMEANFHANGVVSGYGG